MTHKTTAFFNRNCHDYGAQDTALRQQGSHNIVIVGTHSNGATIYMDTNYGHLMELNIPSGTKFRYMFEVTGIK